MEQDEVADCADKEEEAMVVEDVANMTMMEDELEVDQVGQDRAVCRHVWMRVLSWRNLMIMMMMMK